MKTSPKNLLHNLIKKIDKIGYLPTVRSGNSGRRQGVGGKQDDRNLAPAQSELDVSFESWYGDIGRYRGMQRLEKEGRYFNSLGW